MTGLFIWKKPFSIYYKKWDFLKLFCLSKMYALFRGQFEKFSASQTYLRVVWKQPHEWHHLTLATLWQYHMDMLFFTFSTRSFLVSHFQSTMNRCKARSINHIDYHCVKTIRVWSFSGPHFPIFGLNTERYPVSLGIQSECGKMQTRKTSNTDTLHAVNFL